MISFKSELYEVILIQSTWVFHLCWRTSQTILDFYLLQKFLRHCCQNCLSVRSLQGTISDRVSLQVASFYRSWNKFVISRWTTPARSQVVKQVIQTDATFIQNNMLKFLCFFDNNFTVYKKSTRYHLVLHVGRCELSLPTFTPFGFSKRLPGANSKLFPKREGGWGGGRGGGVNIHANQMSKHYHLKLDWNKSAFRGWGESTICQFWTIYSEGDPLSTH